MNSKQKRFQVIVLACAVLGFAIGGIADNQVRNNASRTHDRADSSIWAAYETTTASTDVNIGLDASLSPVVLVGQVLRIIKSHYVDDINPFENSSMAHGAVRYMVSSLGDPNSRFLEPSHLETLRDMSLGTFRGIGAVLKIREQKRPDWTDQELTIVSTIPGTPAHKAGLIPGDVIMEVNDQWVMTHDPYAEAALVTRDHSTTLNERRKALEHARALLERSISLDDAADKLYSPSEEPVNLLVKRGGKEMKVTLSTDEVKPALVEEKVLEDGIGYIHIVLLTPDTPEQFKAAAQRLTNRGVKKIVLDLRNSPGGSVVAAQEIAGMLMPGKDLAIAMRSHDRRETIAAINNGTALDFDVVVLVNQGTEGASEVLAGGLRDSIDVRLIGQNTWGNALERSAFRLEDGSGYTLTTGKFLTPKGTNFNRNGLRPDAHIAMDPGRIGQPDDPQLARALTVLKRPTAQAVQKERAAL